MQQTTQMNAWLYLPLHVHIKEYVYNGKRLVFQFILLFKSAM